MLSCGLYAACGFGLLLLKKWSYPLTIIVQVLGLCSGVVTMLSSNFERLMRQSLSNSPLTAHQSYSDAYIHLMRNLSLVSLVVPVFVLGVLVAYLAKFTAAGDAVASA